MKTSNESDPQAKVMSLKISVSQAKVMSLKIPVVQVENICASVACVGTTSQSFCPHVNFRLRCFIIPGLLPNQICLKLFATSGKYNDVINSHFLVKQFTFFPFFIKTLDQFLITQNRVSL